MPPVKAFIVEDSPVILDNLVATLEELAQVSVVGAAAEERDAMRWIEAPPQPFDLMIIDIFLKSGSGLGVLRAAQDAGITARRVVLTNFANPDIRKRCAELGADRVFDKSSELEDLIEYCSKVADGEPTTVPGALS
jgi:DNA-binding NarL/FixJ family response regulator